MRVSREGNLVTLINVFETQPKLQQTLIEQWMRFAEEVIKEPGFIGAALHRSTDGTRVINYAQWRSEEDFESGCRRSTASKWTPVARSPSASIPIFTKSSISLSGEAVDGLCTSAEDRERVGPSQISGAYRTDGETPGKKGARIVWQSSIESMLSCASTTP